jgi:DNA-binding MurR/RpiR family transcriptional regulator
MHRGKLTHMNLIEKIREVQHILSPRQHRLAHYIVANYRKAAFFSASQLAQAAGVSQPTVVRFCQSLGFRGYPDFMEILQKLVRHELTTIDRFHMSLDSPSRPVHEAESLLLKEIQNLKKLAENFPGSSFRNAVTELVKSRGVFVVGMRGSAALAQYFAYFLRKVKRPVHLLCMGGTQEYDLLMEMGRDDVAVVLAFPRYPRETVEMARMLRRKGRRIIAITDSKASPLEALADIKLILPISFSTLFDSYAVPLCVLNMLVTEVARANMEQSKRLLDEFESLAREIGVFHKSPDPLTIDGDED